MSRLETKIKKSLRKSRKKSLRKSRKKSLRKSRKKSLRKSRKKSLRKSRKKSLRKSKKKSLRKSKKKSLRKRINNKVYTFGFRKQEIKDYWIVYTLKGCKYCEEAKKLLQSKGKEYHAFEGKDREQEIENNMIKANKKINEYQYWPKIFHFVDDKCEFIGGYNDLKQFFLK